jgi:hypothetical protein
VRDLRYVDQRFRRHAAGEGALAADPRLLLHQATDAPWRRAVKAAVRPAVPPPTTITS